MPVSTPHPQYERMQPVIKQVRDASAGNDAIKRGRELYLPGFDGMEQDVDELRRYDKYLLRSFFMGVTGRTEAAMVGMVFRKPATVEVPEQIEAMMENIDGGGMSLDQVAKAALKNILEAGRHVFLVDYPRTPENFSREDERNANLRPVIASYAPENLINWRTDVVNGQEQLTLAVLAEEVDDPGEPDEFFHCPVIQYRVLRLRDGVYTVQLYAEDGTVLVDEFTPRTPSGTLDHIPLHIAGADDNKPDMDMPPLYDLSTVNIAHYQTTADHRENLFIHGQLTLGVTTDLDSDGWNEANPNGIKVGARKGLFLGTTGSLQSVTAPESSSLAKALEDLEQDMIMLGARLVQRGGMAETAEAARINASAEASTLDVAVGNLGEAIEGALIDMALFLGVPDTQISYELNRSFWETSLTSQDLQAIMQAVQGGLIGITDALSMIRRGQMQLDPERTDEDILMDVTALVDDAEEV